MTGIPRRWPCFFYCAKSRASAAKSATDSVCARAVGSSPAASTSSSASGDKAFRLCRNILRRCPERRRRCLFQIAKPRRRHRLCQRFDPHDGGSDLRRRHKCRAADIEQDFCFGPPLQEHRKVSARKPSYLVYGHKSLGHFSLERISVKLDQNGGQLSRASHFTSSAVPTL